MSSGNIDYVALFERFKSLSKGHQAELRRVKTPADLALLPAYYRLFPGVKTDIRWQRVAFLLPFVHHKPDGGALGEKLADKISEARLFQVVRSDQPNDLIQLRRLVQQVEPTVNWPRLGETLFFWNDISKRNLLEDYFLHHKATKKGS